MAQQKYKKGVRASKRIINIVVTVPASTIDPVPVRRASLNSASAIPESTTASNSRISDTVAAESFDTPIAGPTIRTSTRYRIALALLTVLVFFGGVLVLSQSYKNHQLLQEKSAAQSSARQYLNSFNLLTATIIIPSGQNDQSAAVMKDHAATIRALRSTAAAEHNLISLAIMHRSTVQPAMLQFQTSWNHFDELITYEAADFEALEPTVSEFQQTEQSIANQTPTSTPSFVSLVTADETQITDEIHTEPPSTLHLAESTGLALSVRKDLDATLSSLQQTAKDIAAGKQQNVIDSDFLGASNDLTSFNSATANAAQTLQHVLQAANPAAEYNRLITKLVYYL